MGRRTYNPDTKAAALAELLAGQGVSEVAKRYKLPAGTVKGWNHRMRKAEGMATVTTEHKDAIGDLLLGYLKETIVTLQAQAAAFRSTSWLKKQSAADAAVLHGVLADKAVRLLDALNGGQSTELPPSP